MLSKAHSALKDRVRVEQRWRLWRGSGNTHFGPVGSTKDSWTSLCAEQRWRLLQWWGGQSLVESRWEWVMECVGREKSEQPTLSARLCAHTRVCETSVSWWLLNNLASSRSLLWAPSSMLYGKRSRKQPGNSFQVLGEPALGSLFACLRTHHTRARLQDSAPAGTFAWRSFPS